jgi:hypothetical protein
LNAPTRGDCRAKAACAAGEDAGIAGPAVAGTRQELSEVFPQAVRGCGRRPEGIYSRSKYRLNYGMLEAAAGPAVPFLESYPKRAFCSSKQQS